MINYNLHQVVYHGSAASRQTLQFYEFFYHEPAEDDPAAKVYYFFFYAYFFPLEFPNWP